MEEKKSEVQVSVLCFAFNHEKYLERCLKSLAEQKTDFPFEIIVHDDASLDHSADIIRKFAEQYPDRIVPLLEQENQYSKGVSLIEKIMLPHAKGRYIAYCEGDDYWSDMHKLQKQYHYMETHAECAICLHNTVKHDLLGKIPDKLFAPWKKETILTDQDVFIGWLTHFSSYFVRKEYAALPSQYLSYWFGDYVRLLYPYSKGTAAFLPDTMSVYNYNNTAGVTYINRNKDYSNRIKQYTDRKEFLLCFNQDTEQRFAAVIEQRIEELDFLAEYNRFISLVKIPENREKQSIIASAKKLRKLPYYKTYLKNSSSLKRIKTFFKLNGYIFYPIWIRLWKTKS